MHALSYARRSLVLQIGAKDANLGKGVFDIWFLPYCNHLCCNAR